MIFKVLQSVKMWVNIERENLKLYFNAERQKREKKKYLNCMKVLKKFNKILL